MIRDKQAREILSSYWKIKANKSIGADWIETFKAAGDEGSLDSLLPLFEKYETGERIIEEALSSVKNADFLMLHYAEGLSDEEAASIKGCTIHHFRMARMIAERDFASKLDELERRENAHTQ